MTWPPSRFVCFKANFRLETSQRSGGQALCLRVIQHIGSHATNH
jgi:hypothetical protein